MHIQIERERRVQLHFPWLPRLLASFCENLSGLKTIAKYYKAAPEDLSPQGFLDYTRNCLSLKHELAGIPLEQLPSTGPLVVVANHPFGCAEGVTLMSLVQGVRRDIKTFANKLLRCFPELSPNFLELELYSQKAAQSNAKALRLSLAHLKKGGCLIIFPAGQVSHFHWASLQIQDIAWGSVVGMLVQRSQATVCPVFIQGRNSFLFYIFPSYLRTLLLVREFLNKRNKKIRYIFGSCLGSKSLLSFSSYKRLSDYLRLHSYSLARMPKEHPLQNSDKSKLAEQKAPPLEDKAQERSPAASESSEALAHEFASLPKEALLCRESSLDLFVLTMAQAPKILREIGHLRQEAFGSEGGGTGLDEYDHYYLHLVAWNRGKKRIAGAYRMAVVDHVLEERGPGGLYTSSLFRYDEVFFKLVRPCVELGRAFVQMEDRKNIKTLFALWRGLARFMLLHKYRNMIGPVSIGRAYPPVARAMMRDWLRIHHFKPELAARLKALCPFSYPQRKTFWDYAMLAGIVSTEQISRLIQNLSVSGEAFPVLLRQYLKLNAAVLGFNIDREFDNTLDVLIQVDIAAIAPMQLQKYMGPEAKALQDYFRAQDMSAKEKHSSYNK